MSIVPYAGNIHDDLALAIALRLLVNLDLAGLTVLRVAQVGQVHNELSNEFSSMLQQLPQKVRDRIDIKTIEAAEPIKAVVEASATVDLTIVGTSRAWGIERQTLGRYTDELANRCQSSLLIARRYSQVTAHLSSILPQTNSDASINSTNSGVEA